MKKLFIFILLAALGSTAHAIPVSAQTASPVSATVTLSSQDIQALTQTLTALRSLLEAMSALGAQNPALLQNPEIRTALAGITSELVKLSSSLTGTAIANASPSTAPAPLAAATPPSAADKSPAPALQGSGSSLESPPRITGSILGEKSDEGTLLMDADEEEAAVLAETVETSDPRRVIGFIMIGVGVVLALYLYFRRDTEDASGKAIPMRGPQTT